MCTTKAYALLDMVEVLLARRKAPQDDLAGPSFTLCIAGALAIMNVLIENFFKLLMICFTSLMQDMVQLVCGILPFGW